MRVSCLSIDDFIANLTDILPECVFIGVVYVNINRRPIDAETRQKATKFVVTIQASTVVLSESDNQYLLIAGEDCGRDLLTSIEVLDGSNRAIELKQKLVEFCNSKNWKVRPGICSE